MRDQAASTAFYEQVLCNAPRVHVPGMTEFTLSSGSILGLMPAVGIARILCGSIPDIANQPSVPRAELYLLVDDVSPYVERAITAGAREVSAVQRRDWGHNAGYFQDPDGHVLAIAMSA